MTQVRSVQVWIESAGLGHVTRQINLARQLRSMPGWEGANIRFIIDDKPATLDATKRAGIPFVIRKGDLSNAMRELEESWKSTMPDLFVMDSVDHDRIPEASALLTNDTVYSVVVMDDPADRDVSCDLLINALASVEGRSGQSEGRAAFRLYGPEYLILPADFAALRTRPTRARDAECKKGFAFFGGADLENFTEIFIDAVSDDPNIEWTLLLGPSYVHASTAEASIRDGGKRINVVRHIESMAETMYESDIAVIAGGNTLAEAAAAGTPSITFSQNEVQHAHARFYARKCGVVEMGRLRPGLASALKSAIQNLAGDGAARRQMSACMRALVDGGGAERVAQVITTNFESK